MNKLILKNLDNNSFIELLPQKYTKIKVGKLKWVKFNEELYTAEMASILNINFPYTDFNHIFKEVFFIRKTQESTYYISTHRKNESCFIDINPILTLSEAKIICQNLAEDLYDMEYDSTFYIVD